MNDNTWIFFPFRNYLSLINIPLCLINSHNKMNTVILIYHYYKNKCFIIIWSKVPQCSQWNKLTSTSLSVLSYAVFPPKINSRVGEIYKLLCFKFHTMKICSIIIKFLIYSKKKRWCSTTLPPFGGNTAYVIPYIHVRVHVLIQQFPKFPMHVKIKIIITHSDRVSYMPKRKKESMRQTRQ